MRSHNRPILACPRCGSRKVSVYCVRWIIRWHRCHECGARFKSVERHVRGIPADMIVPRPA